MKDKLLVIVTIFCYLSCLSQDNADLPNILWIVSEDNSPFIGAYGDKSATTPNIDQFAKESILYENAFAVAPVCSPTRSTLITGVYASSMGTEHMRSKYPIPDMIRFFPEYLKEKGYYTTNNFKTDYNTSSEGDRLEYTWDESSNEAHYKNRKKRQPFFAVFNLTTTHESSIFENKENIQHDPEKMIIPPYLPTTSEMKHDWAYYYDNIERMDTQVGKLLSELEELGLSENTIVFYYSDHGGILGRSKQYLYDSGLQVPLIIRFPKKYQHLAPSSSGSRTDRLVSFVDFAPSILSLVGIPIPEYMEGRAFLGKESSTEREYVYSFRGRMDERNDLSRGVRDKQFFYRRNYMPHRIYGQHIDYHWKAPSIRSWEKAYKNGDLNDVQAKYWGKKPYEELFDVNADPHNIRNLADNPAYRTVLERMRSAQTDWSIEFKDVGLVPEVMLEEISRNSTPYEFARAGNYSVESIIALIDRVLRGNEEIIENEFHNINPIFRYWAVTACIYYPDVAISYKDVLFELRKDTENMVRLAVAETLNEMGEDESALKVLESIIHDESVIATLNALDIMEIMGDDAKDALPTVKKISKDNRKYSVYEVKVSVKRILDRFDKFE